VVSVLQVPPSDTEGRRFAERYTSSAEAFERFARRLPLAEMADDEGGSARIYRSTADRIEEFTAWRSLLLIIRHLSQW